MPILECNRVSVSGCQWLHFACCFLSAGSQRSQSEVSSQKPRAVGERCILPASFTILISINRRKQSVEPLLRVAVEALDEAISSGWSSRTNSSFAPLRAINRRLRANSVPRLRSTRIALNSAASSGTRLLVALKCRLAHLAFRG